MKLLYALALFMSAALLFLVEPMIGKFVLPSLGSSPAVWTTTLLFFQACLLAGYAFSHATSRLLTPRRQAFVQVALLAAALIALPPEVPASAHAPTSANPIPWLLALLATTAGLPFFALAANGPTLQRWLAASARPAGRDPYFLFAASNAGSLIGLLAYPLLLEPLLTLRSQARVWSAGYLAAGVLVALAGLALALSGRREAPAPAADPPAPIGRARRLRWLALAFVPSSLMLGTTTYITRDLSPVPLLWVVPLALYLLTFVIAFAPWSRPARLVAIARVALPAVVILLVYTLAIGSQRPLVLLLVLNLAVLFAAGLLCHAQLALDRPPAPQLTDFYLVVAAGGVLGGIFNAILAPLVFPTLIEYPLAIVAACLLRPAPAKKRPGLLEFLLRDARPTQAMDVLVPVLLGAAVAIGLELMRAGDGTIPFAPRSALLGVACGLSVNLARRPLRFGLAIAAILIATALVSAAPHNQVLSRSRSFFGIYKVVALGDGRVHDLYDGNTLHGEEVFDTGAPEPLSYYGRAGPAGQAFGALPAASTEHVALVGLGAGTLACYARPRDRFTFYEVDPVVARIARDPRLFTYLSRCPGRYRIVLGDGRRSLQRAASERYGMIVIDAFNSDAIPIHLITREALDLYRARLLPGGAVMFHISNRYLDLEPVLGNLAGSLRLACLVERHTPTRAQADAGLSVSKWVILARRPGDLGRLQSDPRWHSCARDGGAGTWTDSYSNVLGVVSWG